MSEVLVHGVVAADDAGEPPAGTRLIAHRDVAAIASDVAGGQVFAARALREHSRILEAVAAETTVLPVRFGTAMAGDDAVVDEFLAPEHDGLAAGLAEFDGKVQLMVKGTYDEGALLRGVVRNSPSIGRLRDEVARLPGAAGYAKRIQLGELVAGEVERERERDGALALERLEPLAVAARLEAASGPDAAVNAAFLVERARLDAFGSAVAKLGRELEGRVRLRFIGPLPPYSFTGTDAAPGAAAWA
jgi:hypothetical protein